MTCEIAEGRKHQRIGARMEFLRSTAPSLLSPIVILWFAFPAVQEFHRKKYWPDGVEIHPDRIVMACQPHSRTFHHVFGNYTRAGHVDKLTRLRRRPYGGRL
jgi:hypothetical protein